MSAVYFEIISISRMFPVYSYKVYFITTYFLESGKILYVLLRGTLVVSNVRGIEATVKYYVPKVDTYCLDTLWAIISYKVK